MRTLGIIIILLIWLLTGIQSCTDYNDCCANEEDSTEKVTKAAPAAITALANACPLSFKYKSAEPIECNSWQPYRDTLLSTLDEDDELQLTVYYSKEETGQVANARAAAAKALFAGKIDPERIRINLVEQGVNAQQKISAISRTAFRRLNIDANIKEVEDRTLIYFPYGSSQKLNNARIEAYLNDVAVRVKKSGERVSLKGYTDDRSSTASNIRLGQKRADVIRNYLISKGVASNKISAVSGGESNPIATNGTDDGRAKNRRTELQIIK